VCVHSSLLLSVENELFCVSLTTSQRTDKCGTLMDALGSQCLYHVMAGGPGLLVRKMMAMLLFSCTSLRNTPLSLPSSMLNMLIRDQ